MSALNLREENDIAIVEWDLEGEKVNKLSSPVMMELRDVYEQLKNSTAKAIIHISKKDNIFIAGADIDEINKLNTKEDFKKVLKKSHDIFNSIEDLAIPSIAAINGACLGGGLEFAMSCDYRIASDDKATKLGLPETQLGIIPGFGGCIRLPRIIGLKESLGIILAGKSVDGKKAKRLGLVDDFVPKQILLEKALKLAEEIKQGQKGKRCAKYKAKSTGDYLLDSYMGRKVVFSQAAKGVNKLTKGFYPAPIMAIDVIKKTYRSSRRNKSLDIEMDGFCEVATTAVSKHLIGLFYQLESIKKQTGIASTDVMAKKVKSIGVLGAGVMGGGVAYVAADKGIKVRLKDINTGAISLGLKSAYDLWSKKVKRRRLTKSGLKQKLDLVSGGVDFSGFKNLDVVIEAIVENMDIKKSVIKETAEQCDPGCIIATNTSSLRVNEMALAHPNPKNFLGMHFFNPVNKMPLIEVIRGEHTSDEATATIFSLAKKMGKTPVVVKDGPGFLVNRLLLPLLSEGLFFLEEGGDIKQIDRVFTHEFGLPMGPYRLMDEVGLDVCIKVLKIFKDSFGERIQVSKLAEKIDLKKRLGKKNGLGFYTYDERGKEKEVDVSIYDELGLSSNRKSIDGKLLIERAIYLMVNETARAMFEDSIVDRPEQVDLAMIMGTGFPPFRGGLLKYADEVGLNVIVEKLHQFEKDYGVRYAVAASLKNKDSFY